MHSGRPPSSIGRRKMAKTLTSPGCNGAHSPRSFDRQYQVRLFAGDSPLRSTSVPRP